MKKKPRNMKYDSDKDWNCNHYCAKKSNGCGGAVYGLGFIGAVIYYISTASGFWVGVLGFLKALVWPAMVVFEILKFLGA